MSAVAVKHVEPEENGAVQSSHPIAVWKSRRNEHRLKVPTLDLLLSSSFPERQHLLFPWLREQESCMIYADTGVGKSLFALSLAIAVAGGGEFLGWKSDQRETGEPWRVLYVDGEMHIGDIQERARALIEAVPGIDKTQAGKNLSFLARQHQDPGTPFPLITDEDGMKFVVRQVAERRLDLVILDNFSTLGEVEDENSAASFNAIQQFLLNLKVQGVATILVHHAGKSGDFRGSSKLAATFETIIKLERMKEEAEHGEAQFRVTWDKVRAGGPKKRVRDVVAKLVSSDEEGEQSRQEWEYEAGSLSRLDDMKERMANGEFVTQKEMSDCYGLSKTMIGKDIEKGIRIGLWTDRQVNQWLTKGKQFRKIGKTFAPIPEGGSWRDEPDEAFQAFEEPPDF
ncbi:AAA family ATPase [Microvirga terricola]|uniref:AAA family ATPase n=1 Tax=Microvirga terricola TaxID=2719797 RepID=A0ABX0VH00_9HYPH|nr:AAA family ATPase [Microvirga terricola]NIX78105.1 AAA family ATPase [Microvirga terricola]